MQNFTVNVLLSDKDMANSGRRMAGLEMKNNINLAMLNLKITSFTIQKFAELRAKLLEDVEIRNIRAKGGVFEQLITECWDCKRLMKPQPSGGTRFYAKCPTCRNI